MAYRTPAQGKGVLRLTLTVPGRRRSHGRHREESVSATANGEFWMTVSRPGTWIAVGTVDGGTSTGRPRQHPDRRRSPIPCAPLDFSAYGCNNYDVRLEIGKIFGRPCVGGGDSEYLMRAEAWERSGTADFHVP